MQALSREEIAKREIGRTDISPVAGPVHGGRVPGNAARGPLDPARSRAPQHEPGLSRRPLAERSAICSSACPASPRRSARREGGPTQQDPGCERPVAEIDRCVRRSAGGRILPDQTPAFAHPVRPHPLGRPGEREGLRRSRRLALLSAGRRLPDRSGLSRTRMSSPGAPPAATNTPLRPIPTPGRRSSTFTSRLAKSGIRLVLMPTPVKPMIEPDRLSSRYQGRPRRRVLQNPSFERFKAEMNAARRPRLRPRAGAARAEAARPASRSTSRPTPTGRPRRCNSSPSG